MNPSGLAGRGEGALVAVIVREDRRTDRGRPRGERTHLPHPRRHLQLLKRGGVVGVGRDDRERARLVVEHDREDAVLLGRLHRHRAEQSSVDDRLRQLLGRDELGVVEGRDELQEVELGDDSSSMSASSTRLFQARRVLDRAGGAARESILPASSSLVRDASIRFRRRAEPWRLRVVLLFVHDGEGLFRPRGAAGRTA